MPGPWTDADAVVAQVRASLGLAVSADTAAQWPVLAARSVLRGYHRLISLLGARGYSPSAMDSWSGRVTYNLAYSTAFAFRFGSFGASYNEKSNSDELKSLDEELSDPLFTLFDDDGGLITPDADIAATSPISGRMTAFDDDLDRIQNW